MNNNLQEIYKLSDDEKLKVVQELSKTSDEYEDRIKVAFSMSNPILMLQAREMFERKYDRDRLTEKIERIVRSQKPEESVLRRLYDRDYRVLDLIDYRILNDQYVNTLGDDKISVFITQKVRQDLLLSLDDRKYTIFYRCINAYQSNTQSQEWTMIAEKVFEQLASGKYDELIYSIDNIEQLDFYKLGLIMQNSNEFGLKTPEDIDRYEDIVKEKCDEIMSQQGNIEKKKNAVLQKIFGLDYTSAKYFCNCFSEDIANLPDCDEKDLIASILGILSINDEDILKKVYNRCESVGLVDLLAIDKQLRKKYAEMFNEGLYCPNAENLVPEEKLEEFAGKGVKVYNAGTDFKMILTSVSSYDYMNDKIPNHKNWWNRPVSGVEHVCTSYIRNDMIATAGIRHFCYGFKQMNPDTLLSSSFTDATSPMRDGILSFSFDHGGVCHFCTPNTQINNTGYPYNEMDYYFIQDGIKIQPDYIIAFKKNGKIDNLESILKGAEDWKSDEIPDGLPIVVVDVDACLQSERNQLDVLMERYTSGRKTPRLAQEILQKIRNNQHTDSKFGEDIDIKLLRSLQNKANKNELDIEDMDKIINIYKKITDGYFGAAFDLTEILKDEGINEDFVCFYEKVTDGTISVKEFSDFLFEKVKSCIYDLIPDELLDAFAEKIDVAGLSEQLKIKTSVIQPSSMQRIGIEDLSQNNAQVTSQERMEAMQGIRKLREQIYSLINGKEDKNER